MTIFSLCMISFYLYYNYLTSETIHHLNKIKILTRELYKIKDDINLSEKNKIIMINIFDINRLQHYKYQI